jgi:hypothetical protein
MEAFRFISKTIIGAIIICSVHTGCKKKEEETPTPPSTSSIGTTQQTQRASDQTDLETESNQAMDDANSAMSEISTTRDIQSICGMTYDSSTTATTGIITLTYDGTVCSGKKREGTITIQLPVQGGQVVRFSTAGAVAQLTFTNYKITYVATNKSITINGTHTVKNVNQGGLLELIWLSTPIVHKVKANIHVEYQDGTECTWNAKKIRTFSNNGGIIKATIEGDTAIGGYPGTAFWGVNRYGDNYFIDAEVPFSYDLVNSNNCIFKPLTGKINFRWSTYLLTLTYGVNSDGLAASGCPYGYKFNWVDANNTPQQIILPY